MSRELYDKTKLPPIVFVVVDAGEGPGVAITVGYRHSRMLPFPRAASSIEKWRDWMCENFDLVRKDTST